MKKEYRMTHAAIQIDGEFTSGKVIGGLAETGQMVTVEGRDENGMPFEAIGVVVEVDGE